MPGGLTPPLSVIESWPTANLTNPELRSDAYFIIIITFLSLSTVVVFARLWARGVIQRSLALDDYLIFVALMCTASMGVSSCLGMRSSVLSRATSAKR
jgi:hypothetical protein